MSTMTPFRFEMLVVAYMMKIKCPGHDQRDDRPGFCPGYRIGDVRPTAKDVGIEKTHQQVAEDQCPPDHLIFPTADAGCRAGKGFRHASEDHDPDDPSDKKSNNACNKAREIRILLVLIAFDLIG